ncbi:unnamed protein product [Absidia cylindrospora]
MSDTEELYEKSESSTDTQTHDSASNNILRYSKDVLLSLHDSPLVCKPENMPPLSSWFGEEAGSPAAAKTILNSSVVSRSTDKSIVLGPPKTNFASSLYGGLKHTTDSKDNTTLATSRLRQSEDSIRTHTNNNNRVPRGPAYVGEKGFHYHHHNNSYHHHNGRQDKGGSSLERRSSNSFNNQSSHSSKRYHHHQHQSDYQGTDRQTMNSSAGGRREYNRDQRGNNRLSHTNHNDGQDRGQEHVPEWMDYNPDTKTTTDTSAKLNFHHDYANDLEAWKSSMKQKEGLDDTTNTQKHPKQGKEMNIICYCRYTYVWMIECMILFIFLLLESLPQGKDDGASLDKLLDLESLELKPSSSPLDKISSPMPSFFESTSDLPSKRGSRFAKFFAKREEATHASPPPTSSPLATTANTSSTTTQPKSINVNDLFQKPGVSSQQVNANFDNSYSGKETPLNNIRMLSEEDVLQSLGAKKATVSSPELSPSDTNANAIGFNKVLQILSQSKPTVQPSTSSAPDTNVNSSPEINGPQYHEKKLQHNGTMVETSSTTSSPTVKQQPPLYTEMGSPSSISRESLTSESTVQHKKVSNLFGNNLPTSVLRKMSQRSDGRPSTLASNKSGHSGRFSHSMSDSRNGSPLIGNALSPSSAHITPTQQHYQQATHSPSSHGYHGYPLNATADGNNSQSPQFHHDLRIGASTRSMSNDMMLMNPQASRHQQTNRYDNVVQQQMYGDSDTTGMPPPRHLPPTIHPAGSSSMNRMMSPQFMQQHQQQQLGSTMDPSFMSHPPPPQMMGMPGMMTPHLPMRPQGQTSNTGNGVPPPHPPFIQPMMPQMPPPPPMGMPQQMYANKNNGWNHQ